MSSLTVPNLTLRSEKGSGLTNAEMDANWTTLRTFCNSLSALTGVSLNTDGTLKDDSVESGDITDRAVGPEHLKLTALPAFEDVGTTNALRVSPDPAVTAYEDRMIFFVKVLNANTGPTTFQVGDGLDALPLKKQGRLELIAGDISAGQVIALEVYDGVAHLIGGSGNSTSGGNVLDTTGNLQGVVFNEVAALEAVGDEVEFNHALNQVPDIAQVYLDCVQEDAPYSVGDEIPIEELTGDSVNFTPAFTVKITTSYVIVTQQAAAVYDKLGGTALDIATPKWQLRVRASKHVNAQPRLQAAATFQLAGPDGAMSYGQNVICHCRGANASGDSRLIRVNLATGVAEFIATNVPPAVWTYTNFSLIRSSLGEDRVVWGSSEGIHFIQAQEPTVGAWTPDRHTYQGNWTYMKPLAVEEAGVDTTATAWLAPQRPTPTLTLATYYINRADIVAGVVTGPTQYNLRFFSAQNVTEFSNLVAATAGITSLSYNPVKGRLYLTENSTCLLHIFEFAEVAGSGVTGLDIMLP